MLLPQVHHEFLLWEGCNKDAKSRYNNRLAQLLPRYIYSPCIINWDVLKKMGCDGEIDDMLRIRVREAASEEEVFTLVAWIRAFNINEPIYAEFCHEFYSTYEFDEVCADDELQSKKIIKFRLGGRAHSLTLLEFARRLGLYQAVELEEDGFNVYLKEEGYDKLLWGDLITLFEPSEEDEIWKAQQDYTLISWRLFDSCGIHLLLTDTGITIHMLVERKYPLTQEMLSRMLSRRLEVDHECEMAYELLRFTRSQLKK
ncbi:hypothetical protein Tco_1561928 [Tanacetum coccineum]